MGEITKKVQEIIIWKHRSLLNSSANNTSHPLVAVRLARAQWSVVHKVAPPVPLPTTPEHLIVRLLDRPPFGGDSLISDTPIIYLHIFFFIFSHFYVGSMYDDIRLHVARSYTSSSDSHFSLISSFTLSNHLLLGVPLFLLP